MAENLRPLEPPRLAFLDGVRGLAALFVVVHHAWFEVFATGGEESFSPWLRAMTGWMFYGHHAVDVFIVVSGYCLALPLVHSGDAQLAGGKRGFLWRRARRILPPYYAALIFSLALIVLVPSLNVASHGRWDRALPGVTWDAVGSHLLLVHNLFPSLIWQINPPMWSIATEWQIYFLFALVLVPVYRRLGMVAALCVAVLAGSVPGLFTQRFAEACPWFAGLFVLGWLAAQTAHSGAESYGDLRQRVPWSVLSRGGLILYLLLIFFTDLLSSTGELADGFVGFVAAVTLIDLSIDQRQGIRARMLESAAGRWLGACSYSLYLVHFPLLAWAHIYLRQSAFAPVQRLLIMFLLIVPAVVAAAYLFSILFERPFLSRRLVYRDEIGTDAIIPHHGQVPAGSGR